MVEVVAEDEGVAGDGFLGDEGEGDAVLVVLVVFVGEIGGGGGGSFGEAWMEDGMLEVGWWLEGRREKEGG